MNLLEIQCEGESLRLLPDKAIHWPEEGMIIVADLHFGKSAAFRAAGIAVPETTTVTDLARLVALVQFTKATRVLMLGDLLHAQQGMQPEMMDAFEKWRAQHSKVELILVQGNHDAKCDPLPKSWNMVDSGTRWTCGPFVFGHKPTESKKGYVISGHLHPAIMLRDSFGAGIRAPCFWFARKYAVLPAFGSFTGMKTIRAERGDRVYAAGNGEVIQVVG
jgi:uncharacterized protein